MDILNQYRGIAQRWNLLFLYQLVILVVWKDITTSTWALASLIFLLLLMQEENTLKHLYIDIFCLMFILLLWPFTSPKYLDADIFFFVSEQVKKVETFFNLLIVVSGVLCFFYILTVNAVCIAQHIYDRPKTKLFVCIVLLGCEYLIYDIFEQFIESVVQSNYGNYILQILIHILMYVVTFEIFQIYTSSLGLVYIYFCITHYFVSPIATTICISSVLIVCLISYELYINYNINFQMIKTFFIRIRRDNQRLREIVIILFVCVLTKLEDILL